MREMRSVVMQALVLNLADDTKVIITPADSAISALRKIKLLS